MAMTMNEDGMQGADAKVSVVVAEDSPTQALRLRHLLESRGYEVRGCGDGLAALEAVRAAPPTLVISDVVMPRMDGPTLIKELRTRRPDIRVIFISGYAEDAFRKRVDAGEEAHFLMKPFTLKQLAAKVKEVLEVH
jgi:two-component system cell cycle sensor histidine kinase/response regulator CckA